MPHLKFRAVQMMIPPQHHLLPRWQSPTHTHTVVGSRRPRSPGGVSSQLYLVCPWSATNIVYRPSWLGQWCQNFHVAKIWRENLYLILAGDRAEMAGDIHCVGISTIPMLKLDAISRHPAACSKASKQQATKQNQTHTEEIDEARDRRQRQYYSGMRLSNTYSNRYIRMLSLSACIVLVAAIFVNNLPSASARRSGTTPSAFTLTMMGSRRGKGGNLSEL
jgi:hypothetical protein